jgi:hypothetical protein
MPSVVAFLASHLSTQDQCDELALCLASACQQSELRLLLVSWSAKNAEVAAVATKIFEQASQKARFIVPLQQKATLSQFQHFERCLTHVEKVLIAPGLHSAEDLWVMFSDDDDLWHANRVQVYASSLRAAQQQFPAQLAEVHSLLCATFATEALERADYERAWKLQLAGQRPGLRASPRSAGEVDAWLADKRARLADVRTKQQGQKDTGGLANQEECEYWQYCTRLSVLAAFLRGATSALLRSRFCDMAFKTHLRCNLKRPLLEAQAPPGCWVYYHSKRKVRCANGGSASAHPRIP